MARRKRVEWREANRLPDELVQQGIMPWVMAHMQANPYCWACGALGTDTVSVQSREINAAGGNVTMYTLCERCGPDPAVRQRLLEDLERDEARARLTRNN